MENGNDSKKVKLSDGSIFGELPVYPPDPIFNVKDSYNADPDPSKVNLGIGGTQNPSGFCTGCLLPWHGSSQPTGLRRASPGCCQW